MSWTDTPVMVLDFETTSLPACTTRPVQIGFAIFDPWSRSLENEKNDIVNSGARSTPEALKVHGITDARAVKEGVPIKEAFGSLVETITKHSDYPIMMYNAPFDFTILNQECKRHGLQLPTLNVLDPLLWARKFCPAPHELGVMAERFGIPHANAHDALADVRTTIDVALSITQDNSTLGTASIKELQTLQKEWSRGSWPARLCAQPSPSEFEALKKRILDDSNFVPKTHNSSAKHSISGTGDRQPLEPDYNRRTGKEETLQRDTQMSDLESDQYWNDYIEDMKVRSQEPLFEPHDPPHPWEAPLTPPNSHHKFLLVDGHAVIYGAWFAYAPYSLMTSYGQNTTGASGFMTMLLKLMREQNPTHIAVTFDTKAPTFRKDLFPAYKAHRQEVDPALHEQIPIVKEILAPMGIPVYEYDGFEADDLIGTLSKQATEKGISTLIVTSDTGQLQLVDERTSLLMISDWDMYALNATLYDPEKVTERYDGLGPEYIAEIKALEGETSSNIPGVLGVGKKSARTVLAKLGHFSSLFNNLSEIERIDGLRGAKRTMNLLHEHRETAYNALVLTTIVRDVPIDFDAEQSKFGQFDRKAVIKILMNYELRLAADQLPQTDTPKPLGEYQSWMDI